ncbi:MAG: ATP-binding protein [Cyanobacteria bacterium P01_G01_bin.19]
MENISLKIENYKCFKSKQGFEEIKRVNVLIGKNNSGKSSLLDLISQASQENFSFDKSTFGNNSQSKIYYQKKISQELIQPCFTERSTYILNDYRMLEESVIEWQTIDNKSFKTIYCSDTGFFNILKKFRKDKATSTRDYEVIFLKKNMPTSIHKKTFKHFSSERDIIPEPSSRQKRDVSNNGQGATNLIQRFINSSELPSDLVKKDLLKVLNDILTPDANFIDILSQEHENGAWEIYLEEENKGKIPLSKSGSGLKTIILTLVFTLLIPKLENKVLAHYIYAFEELENNMHPSLLRRLIKYLDDLSLKHKFSIFITTHSSVLIDYFSKKDDAQIVHVTHKNGESFCHTVNRHIENFHILDDLGIKASDLLQANGVIWVEGASDVVYIKKWLEMYVEENNISEKPIQGRHYEFQMYGGTLLDSLCLIKNNSDEEEEYKKLVSMFSFSRNAFIVIDSDSVKNADNQIVDQSNFSAAKKYIKKQIESLSKENYNLGLWYKRGFLAIRTIEDYLDQKSIDFAQKSWSKKIKAQKITESWDESKKLEDFPHNLKSEIKTLYEYIEIWNS